MNALLANEALATEADWTVTWVGLTTDRANLAYLATNPSSNQVAVCLRGTVVSSLLDAAEDLEVTTLLPFGDGNISQGAMKAFTEVTSATNVLGNGATTLLQAVAALVSASSSQLTIFVAGHSLGGALGWGAGVLFHHYRDPGAPHAHHPGPAQPGNGSASTSAGSSTVPSGARALGHRACQAALCFGFRS